MASSPPPAADQPEPLGAQTAFAAKRFHLSGEVSVRPQEAVAVEEPLEIRVRGISFAVLMRTPGRDRDLAAGFLAAEGLVHHRDDLLALEACVNPQTGKAEDNILNAALAEGIAFSPRLATVSSACGMCGTRTLEDLQKDCPPLAASAPAQLSLSALHDALEALRARQPVFAETAATHGAALWDYAGNGELLDVAEDVGRHNAVDQLFGAKVWADQYPVAQAMGLLLSGRISFELIQKAWLAAVPVVIGIGMPTSLAVETAKAAGITLIGWVRNDAATVFAGQTELVD
ncbi:MAG: formate dehydrogenase accessory sulfurtransferase FdhD [Planctomycetes bacterium]|nr:formate dehydrogenase accessory sulfurtransferase FdhD [Planctomycetota bacterium]MCP4771431.1 formate dehydrogenase accessory sulfurtransferase FdhD [Planctomycetota bacterium]MCP4861868.1 formate dehydrogenase accessory sulfurtransferase FdhD [Planctomycetota bacterium]